MITANQASATLVGSTAAQLEAELEKAWANVFKIVDSFVSQHDKFGFKLIELKINPSIEDMLLSLKVMGSILNVLDDTKSLDHSEQRMLLNAKQQIILFERASLALKDGQENEYEKIVEQLRNQAPF